jgi:hypothetical protein
MTFHEIKENYKISRGDPQKGFPGWMKWFKSCTEVWQYENILRTLADYLKREDKELAGVGLTTESVRDAGLAVIKKAEDAEALVFNFLLQRDNVGVVQAFKMLLDFLDTSEKVWGWYKGLETRTVFILPFFLQKQLFKHGFELEEKEKENV